MYKMGFEDLAPGQCQTTHIQPFSSDLHLFGFECKQSAWLAAVLLVTIGIKLFQNWLYTKIGQLQRELLQIDREERRWNTPKVLSLLWWEFVNMLKKRDGTDEEAKRAKAAIDELRKALDKEPVELKAPEEQKLLRQRLLL